MTKVFTVLWKCPVASGPLGIFSSPDKAVKAIKEDDDYETDYLIYEMTVDCVQTQDTHHSVKIVNGKYQIQKVNE